MDVVQRAEHSVSLSQNYLIHLDGIYPPHDADQHDFIVMASTRPNVLAEVAHCTGGRHRTGVSGIT